MEEKILLLTFNRNIFVKCTIKIGIQKFLLKAKKKKNEKWKLNTHFSPNYDFAFTNLILKNEAKLYKTAAFYTIFDTVCALENLFVEIATGMYVCSRISR